MASELALPSSVTVLPATTVCAAPAWATGAALAELAVMVTLDDVLLACPSLTTRVTTYAPAMSAVKLGFADVAAASVALLPTGLVMSFHW